MKNASCVSVKKIWVFSLDPNSTWANNSVVWRLEHINKNSVLNSGGNAHGVCSALCNPGHISGSHRELQLVRWSAANRAESRNPCRAVEGTRTCSTEDRLIGGATAILRYWRCYRGGKEVDWPSWLQSTELRQMDRSLQGGQFWINFNMSFINS